jgi:hypothetical protein
LAGCKLWVENLQPANSYSARNSHQKLLV